MVKIIIPALIALVLTGCSGFVEKVKNTELKGEYFSSSVDNTRECIQYQSILHRFYFEKDEPLPNGNKRYNLLKGDNIIVNLDMGNSGRKTLVNFFYDKRTTGVEEALSDIIKKCHRELD